VCGWSIASPTENTAPAPTIGVDLGGTHLRVGVVDASGSIVAEVRDSAPHEFDVLIEVLGGLIDTLRNTHEANAVGVGAAGLVDSDGTVRYAPNLPMFVDARRVG